MPGESLFAKQYSDIERNNNRMRIEENKQIAAGLPPLKASGKRKKYIPNHQLILQTSSNLHVTPNSPDRIISSIADGQQLIKEKS